MRRLLRFFALLTLRVLAVVTVIVWGASQVVMLYALAPFAGGHVSLLSASDGWTVGFGSPAPSGIHAGVADRINSLSEGFPGNGSVIDEQLWFFSDNQRVLLGVSYLLTLVMIFATYAAFWFFSRRRQRSLQSKLADAARLR
ncbi:hypothetical protein Fuma_01072 [Fuerstiella marisgermanici]|uniref:Uncharacterized protein n=1 Tax=Fuerstiella marisgermanici TaxID=1891926 RepID=A0A1P8WBS1_9PLAN|nr:hypothetical protein Fuma_01072 [Fuerstiella marisgermanici]